jgi:hypothetical protein
MQIVCKAGKATPAQKEIMGLPYSNSDFDITEGVTYLVFGMTIDMRENKNSVCFIQILSNGGHLITAPLFLFDITDNRVSRYWELKISSEGFLTLWPPSFYREYYHDDLFEEVDEVVKDFNLVRKSMEDEYRSSNVV